ncbi:SMI1/KNR4 family protein [Shewanella sp. 202IG2-18]|nr:SMI1/KNR4 family protein [Parashewanella hymeniacidonis]
MGLRLPKDYSKFLEEHNGLILTDGTYCNLPFIKVDDQQIGFFILYSVDAQNERYDLENNNDYSDELEEHFQKALIIGDDVGGNFYVLDCKCESGVVYYWDRARIHLDEGYDIPEVDEEGNLYKVCNSFNEFYELIMSNVSGNRDIETSLL